MASLKFLPRLVKPLGVKRSIQFQSHDQRTRTSTCCTFLKKPNLRGR
jgi:hypothetical protein